jgi:hypothetical protein
MLIWGSAEGAALCVFDTRYMTLKHLIICLLLLSAAVPASVAGDFSLDGYVKSYLYLFQPASVQDPSGQSFRPSTEALWSNRFRLQASYTPRSWMRMDAAYDLAPRIQSKGLSGNSLLFGRIDPFSYRALDLDPDLYPSGPDAIRHFALGQNLDRAAVTLRSRSVDFTLGRQAIAWGSARVINPTDVLAPFTFESLDTEDRIGIDAVRARIPLGRLSEIDVGYVFGKDFEFCNSAFYARSQFNALRTDLSVLIMGFRENLLAGFDLARSFGGAGFWLETAGVFTGAMDGENHDAERNYFRASSGLDYSFTGNTYGFIEYHFNGAGAALPRDYLSRAAESAYTEGSVYLMGRHYLIPGLAYQCNPLVSLTFQAMINVTDPSFLLAPQVEYNIAPSVYLGAGAFLGIGEKSIIGDMQMPALHSEFGGYPNIFFASLRRYF